MNLIHYYKFFIKKVLQYRLKRATRRQFWLNEPTRYVRGYTIVDAAHQRLENPDRCSLAHYSALHKRGAMQVLKIRLLSTTYPVGYRSTLQISE